MKTQVDFQTAEDSDKKISKPPSRVLIIAITLALIWWAVLFWLSFFRANQTIPNRVQIGRSTHVVVAKTGDLDSGLSVTVTDSLRGDLKQGTSIVIENLHTTIAKSHRIYFFPITRFGNNQLGVTPCPAPDKETKILSIYPYSPEIEAKIRTILEPKKKRNP